MNDQDDYPWLKAVDSQFAGRPFNSISYTIYLKEGDESGVEIANWNLLNIHIYEPKRELSLPDLSHIKNYARF